MKQPEEFFCRVHAYRHKRGSKAYEDCLENYLKSLGSPSDDIGGQEDTVEVSLGAVEEVEESYEITEEIVEKVEEVEEEAEPVEIQMSGIYVSSIASKGENAVLCCLIDDAPNEVTIKSGIYDRGLRIFSKADEPFEVTVYEYNSVLNRGVTWFKLV